MIEFDLHIHSKYSFDSLMKPRIILKTARKKGLDIIAVTDHETIKGGLETKKEKKQIRIDVEVIVGAEIPTDAGDIIGLILNEEIRPGEISDVIDEIHSQGGLVLLPHPLKGHRTSIMNASLNKVDMVELLNSRMPLTAEDISVIRGLGKRLVGCSDAHFPSEIGLCRTATDSPYCYGEIDDFRNFFTGMSTVTISGGFSPLYLSAYSELIKSIRLKQYRQIPLQALQTFCQVIRKI